MLTERELQFAELAGRADRARAGLGGAVMVCGESGAGKSSFVEAFVDRWAGGERVLWGACDPLSTPRPLGPIHDLAGHFAAPTQALLRESDHPYQIFAAVFAELSSRPTVLVLDDLHWADQATIDLFRFVLRRVSRTGSLVIGIVRDDEVGVAHPMRSLLGDVARSSHAATVEVPPLSLAAITMLVGDRPVDPVWLRRVTSGNAFFVCEMLDHRGGDLPTTVRDAILARTVGLDDAAWDALHLLTCAPGAIPDGLLADLGVTLPALRALDGAKLIRRTARGVAFRHDLCRLAIATVMPPGVEPRLHRRLLDAYQSHPWADPAVLTHHALGAGDPERVQVAAAEAGRAAARSGAHTQAAEFYRIALSRGGRLSADDEAELLELLAAEYYLTDRLDDAIGACRRAMGIRRDRGTLTAVSADHHALAVYEWYNANRTVADDHVVQAISVLDGMSAADDAGKRVQLGHAFAMQAFLAVQSSELERAGRLLARAREIADDTSDSALVARVGLIAGYCGILTGQEGGREEILAILDAGPAYIDEVYSSGYSNLSYFDIEYRQFDRAAELLDISIPLMNEHDLPVCRVWQLGSRARLKLMQGNWDDAVVDAGTVLDSPGAPLARTWPLLVRALVTLRRDGAGAALIDEAWELACRYGEPLRTLPAAAAVAEAVWLTGSDDARIGHCRRLLETAPVTGLEWSRGELAVWLHRIDPTVGADGVAEPYRLLLDGDYERAAEAFHRLSSPYDAALALVDSGDAGLARRALDILDRLDAAAVAAKVRRTLRERGFPVVPARRRSSTLRNPAGLTARQVEVLQLVDAGLTNAELAERLYLSTKTVDHHVSAILTKLEVTGRRDAVRRARQLGIIG